MFFHLRAHGIVLIMQISFIINLQLHHLWWNAMALNAHAYAFIWWNDAKDPISTVLLCVFKIHWILWAHTECNSLDGEKGCAHNEYAENIRWAWLNPGIILCWYISQEKGNFENEEHNGNDNYILILFILGKHSLPPPPALFSVPKSNRFLFANRFLFVNEWARKCASSLALSNNCMRIIQN